MLAEENQGVLRKPVAEQSAHVDLVVARSQGYETRVLEAFGRLSRKKARQSILILREAIFSARVIVIFTRAEKSTADRDAGAQRALAAESRPPQSSVYATGAVCPVFPMKTCVFRRRVLQANMDLADVSLKSWTVLYNTVRFGPK